VETATKAGNRQVARDITRRHPLEFARGWHYSDATGWVRDNRIRDVLLAGQILEIRDRSGRVVLSEQFPDYYVPYRSWARAVWMRPRPLPRSLRAKLRGGR
jgi:hypothetical protein